MSILLAMATYFFAEMSSANLRTFKLNFISTHMHGQNVEFVHLIPGKFCFWRETFAILRKTFIIDGYFGHFLTKFYVTF